MEGGLDRDGKQRDRHIRIQHQQHCYSAPTSKSRVFSIVMDGLRVHREGWGWTVYIIN